MAPYLAGAVPTDGIGILIFSKCHNRDALFGVRRGRFRGFRHILSPAVMPCGVHIIHLRYCILILLEVRYPVMTADIPLPTCPTERVSGLMRIGGRTGVCERLGVMIGAERGDMSRKVKKLISDIEWADSAGWPPRGCRSPR